MTNNLVYRVDMIDVNEDGTIEIIDIPGFSREYPFTFQYKLYLTFEENEERIRQLLFYNSAIKFDYTPRFLKYLENRRLLYEKVSRKYLPLVCTIMHSDFSEFSKSKIIQRIELELNRLYPYKG